ncbi:hypothetical protein SDC9_89526 [bioreactor metagenome]|uniref:Uncharacterized protein n=1 Tax=bioreactor metagenome TaxID=1076179 RepID=A0A644ZZ74_9ZZZZ
MGGFRQVKAHVDHGVNSNGLRIGGFLSHAVDGGGGQGIAAAGKKGNGSAAVGQGAADGIRERHGFLSLVRGRLSERPCDGFCIF